MNLRFVKHIVATSYMHMYYSVHVYLPQRTNITDKQTNKLTQTQTHYSMPQMHYTLTNIHIAKMYNRRCAYSPDFMVQQCTCTLYMYRHVNCI